MYQDFQELLAAKGKELYRDMPWRLDTRPYYILVSELMLQQTQVARVLPKFEQFIQTFPTESGLAQASLAQVLTYWQGLGYNRRAKYLHDSAKKIMNEFGGRFPETDSALLILPGVGKNTAGAIAAYAYNQPVLFVETNIRTVYIHHFFPNQTDISDDQIIEKLILTIDRKNPREFYWALMDYGSWLKQTGVKNVSSSKHYKKQPALQGSIRQVRGEILRALTEKEQTSRQLQQLIHADQRYNRALASLHADGLIAETNGTLHLTK